MSDLLRPESDVLDDVIADCRSLSLGGRKHVEVTVTTTEATRYDGEEPVSASLDIVYEVKRTDHGLGKHPIKRPETVANLCLDPELRTELDNPGYMTEDAGVATEANLQVLARLHQLAVLQRTGLIKKIMYKRGEKEPIEVTDDVLMFLSGELSIPAKAHQLHDDYAA